MADEPAKGGLLGQSNPDDRSRGHRRNVGRSDRVVVAHWPPAGWNLAAQATLQDKNLAAQATASDKAELRDVVDEAATALQAARDAAADLVGDSSATYGEHQTTLKSKVATMRVAGARLATI